MQKILALAVLALLAFPIATEAQTITGRLDPQYDAESGFYEYGPLYWDVTVAPSVSRSDEFGLNLYYNKVRAAMLVSLLCPDSDGDFERHARSISAEHFISLTTGLSPGDDCVLFLLGLSTRNEVLSYRMRVSELATRETESADYSSFAAEGSSGFSSGFSPGVEAIIESEFDKLEAELTRLR